MRYLLYRYPTNVAVNRLLAVCHDKKAARAAQRLLGGVIVRR